MRNNFFNIAWLLFILSCTQKLDINLEKQINTLAMTCTFNPGDGFEAYFSRTTNITSDAYPDIGTLIIRLYENDSLINESVIDTNFWQFNYAVNENNSYHIEVEDTTGNLISAKSVIPDRIFIQGASIKPVLVKTDIGEGEDFRDKVTITWTDPQEEANFYQVVIYSFSDNFSNESRSYWNSFISEDPVLTTEGDLDYSPVTIFFSDQLFNGETYTMSIINANGGLSCINGTCLPDRHRVELRSITRDYYLFLKYFTRHYNNQQITEENPSLDMLFLGEPVDMYTNVENGFGIFSGYSFYSTEFKRIPVQQQ